MDSPCTSAIEIDGMLRSLRVCSMSFDSSSLVFASAGVAPCAAAACWGNCTVSSASAASTARICRLEPAARLEFIMSPRYAISLEIHTDLQAHGARSQSVTARKDGHVSIDPRQSVLVGDILQDQRHSNVAEQHAGREAQHP